MRNVIVDYSMLLVVSVGTFVVVEGRSLIFVMAGSKNDATLLNFASNRSVCGIQELEEGEKGPMGVCGCVVV